MPDATWTTIAAIATGIAAVATVVLAIATVYLGVETRRLATETNNALKAERQAENNRRAEVHAIEAQLLRVSVQAAWRIQGDVKLEVSSAGPDPVLGVVVTLSQAAHEDQRRDFDVFYPSASVPRVTEPNFTYAIPTVPADNPLVVVRSRGMLGQTIEQAFDLRIFQWATTESKPLLVQTGVSIQPNVPGAPAIEI